MFSGFYFSEPGWLWGLLVLPFVVGLFFLLRRRFGLSRFLEKFIDKDLLPHLVKNEGGQSFSFWRWLLVWCLVVVGFVLALAGPRWDYVEVDVFSPSQSLVVLLDLSLSMNAQDVKPSRLVRARQEIEDILRLRRGVKVGLVAFAASPHMISPVTDDMETILHLLPSVDTGLVFAQGSRLGPALVMAKRLLGAESGAHKSVLVVSDGGFEDVSVLKDVQALADEGVVVHVLGVGTEIGAPVVDNRGAFVKRGGQAVVSKLNVGLLQSISQAGQGVFLQSHFSDEDSRVLLDRVDANLDVQEEADHKMRFWEERFYVFLFPVLFLLLFWFRRGFQFAVVVVLLLPFQDLLAADVFSLFRNQAQQGQVALEGGDFQGAVEAFHDSYRKGVAFYRSGQFEDAEKAFRASSREGVEVEAQYNLGNALAKQQKFKEALVAYESALEQAPDFSKAQSNFDFVKSLLDQQQEQGSEGSQDESSDGDNDQAEKGDEQGSSESAESSESGDFQQDGEQSQEGGSQSADTGDSQEGGEQEEDASEGEDGDAFEDLAGAEGDAHEGDEKEVDGESGVGQQATLAKSQLDLDADQWLNRLSSDSGKFLKNQFYLESKRQGVKETGDPW